jgi:HCOMODA/2-hydroxy-3-carboxy-muconic semialdehyde decarboxylase
MNVAREALEELVTANRILAREGVVDGFGHVSIRHPGRPDRFVMSRARAPECIEVEDLLEYTIEGEPITPGDRKSYSERFIHGGIYEARRDVHAIVHHHSPSVIPFGVTGTRLRPLMHMCASMGDDIPTWDSHSKFGDTNLLVSNLSMARDLAAALGNRPVALMRGHGAVVAGASLREVVFNSIYSELNADLQMKAHTLGEITFLSEGEVRACLATRASYTFERAWERWCRRAGRAYDERPMEGPLTRV